jgi:sterol desaturase/sphingolipid hydroxylase (fatty acid hydroxylase superfamily)
MSHATEMISGPAGGIHPRRRKPLAEYKREQARISRKSLLKTSAFYTTYSVIVLYYTMRSAHMWWGTLFYVVGMWSYTFIEYISHRWLFHHVFKRTPGIEGYLHKLFDSVHNGHHENPLDGEHINGDLKDLLPLFVVAAPLSFFVAPIYTLPAMLAGTVEGYVITEWIHHCMHFYKLRDPYFRYARRHHFYHHSPKGERQGFGVTNGFWDIWFKTRYPKEVRWALHKRRRTQSAPESKAG